MLAALLVLTTGIFASWYLWFSAHAGLRSLDRFIYAGLVGACQIVGSEILLGAAGLLRPALLAALNAVLTIVTLSWAIRSGALRQLRLAAQARGFLAAMSPVSLLMLALAGFVSLWMAVATWLLPPRGVDDLVYHLPPLYELVRTGRIDLLPLQLRGQFALPLGGDFLYLWPLVFLHADTWVDGVQFIVALFGVGVVAGFARILGATAVDALFAGLAWLFVPVVLAQSASNYVEITLALAHLILLYAAVRFWQTGGWLHLVMAGLAAGFGLGVKYSILVGVATVQPLLILRLWRDGGLRRTCSGVGVFILAMLPLSGWWLARNALVTSFPLFPYAVSLGGLRDISQKPLAVQASLDAGGPAGSAFANLLDTPVRLLTYLFEDPGLGSLNGGFGLIFWGLAMPALAWCLCRAVLAVVRGRDWLWLLLWSQVVPVTLAFLVQTDVSRLRFNLRLLLVVVGLALVALAVLLSRLRDHAPTAAGGVRVAGLLASCLAVVNLGQASLPVMQISEAVADRVLDRATTPFRYYRQAPGDMAELGAAFDALDYLTRDGPGWAISLAAEWRVFNTAPLYGTRLQNRVWNFEEWPAALADAYVFQRPAPGGYYFDLWPGPDMTPDDLRRDGRFERVPLPTSAELWIRSERLDEAGMRARLEEFQRLTGGPG